MRWAENEILVGDKRFFGRSARALIGLDGLGFEGYTDDEVHMRKETPKKKAMLPKKGKAERPLELDRSWHELEAQHDRIKTDWSSLAAQLGVTASDDE